MVVALGGPVTAQQGIIAGRVVNATTLAPVPQARIRIVGDGLGAEAVSESDGTFQLTLPAGVYDLLVEEADFAPARFERIRVMAGRLTTRNLPLESRGFRLAGFVVTASRGTLESEITAPSSSHSVRDQEITERPTPSPVNHLRETPGVDIATQGIQSSNLVVRGFNNIFSGALHMLTDHRLAGLPSLRVNFMHLLPLNDFDIERIEVILGQGSALYGANTANGVVHVITRSPLESPGSTMSLALGERSSVLGAFRSAFLVQDNFGVKVSGQFFRGRDWPHADSTELAARMEATADLPGCIAEREIRGLSPAEAETACRRVGLRDDGVRRFGVEARADWRFSRRGALVGTVGVTDVSGIELTGLGAAQTRNWLYEFVQARLTYDRWAVQGYVNLTESGESFLLRNGLPLIDRSLLGVFQAESGFELAGGRQDFSYGFDYFANRPSSGGTIYGDYEHDNDVTAWGLFLQSRTAVSSNVDLVAAGRIDNHSILPDRVFSPRVALLVKPNDRHAVRFAYNQAFSTPTALNFFLDLGAGFAGPPLGPLGYTTRAFGTGRNGFAWQNDDGSLRGMRSPFNPGGPGELLDADAATLWRLGLGVAQQRAPLPTDVLEVLRGLTPGASDVAILYQDVTDPARGLRPLSTLTLPDVPAIRESNTESFEVGWSGVFDDDVRVSLDVYYRRQNDFVSPLIVETPLLYLERAGLHGWLTSTYLPARVQDLVGRLGFTVEAATAQATAEAQALLPGLAAGIGEVPLAVTASDVPEMANGGADLIATYRNVGDLDLWGADASIQWLLGPEWTLGATWSHVSRNWFRLDGSSPLALNAPADKGTVSLRYRSEARGMNASARVRHTGSFPFLSTDFAGTKCISDAPVVDFQEACIAAATLLDLTWGFRVPRTAATLDLAIDNVLDTDYRSMVGAPSVGRMALVRLRYEF